VVVKPGNGVLTTKTRKKELCAGDALQVLEAKWREEKPKAN